MNRENLEEMLKEARTALIEAYANKDSAMVAAIAEVIKTIRI